MAQLQKRMGSCRRPAVRFLAGVPFAFCVTAQHRQLRRMPGTDTGWWLLDSARSPLTMSHRPGWRSSYSPSNSISTSSPPMVDRRLGELERLAAGVDTGVADNRETSRRAVALQDEHSLPVSP